MINSVDKPFVINVLDNVKITGRVWENKEQLIMEFLKSCKEEDKAFDRSFAKKNTLLCNHLSFVKKTSNSMIKNLL